MAVNNGKHRSTIIPVQVSKVALASKNNGNGHSVETAGLLRLCDVCKQPGTHQDCDTFNAGYGEYPQRLIRREPDRADCVGGLLVV